jgi:hypothetical protein
VTAKDWQQMQLAEMNFPRRVKGYILKEHHTNTSIREVLGTHALQDRT